MGSAIEELALLIYLLYERISEGKSFLSFFRFIYDVVYSRVNIHNAAEFFDPVRTVIRDISFDNEQIDVVDIFFPPGRGTEQDYLLRLVLFNKLFFDVVDLF